jgi:hypothetical protein
MQGAAASIWHGPDHDHEETSWKKLLLEELCPARMGFRAHGRPVMARVNGLIGAAALIAALSFFSVSKACPTSAPAAAATAGSFAAARATKPVAPVASQDPVEFFAGLVSRYRALRSYEDTGHLVQVSMQSGGEPRSIETDIACAIREDELSVTTPALQVARAAGIEAPSDLTPAMKALVRKYNLRLAPHMALRFTDEPLSELMPGVDEAFTPTSLTPVKTGGRDLVRVELRSGDGASEHCAATFQLDVDPQTMLVRRVQSRQVLPDGALYESTLDITPTRVEAVTVPASAPVAATPSDPRPATARTRTAATPKPETAPDQPGAPGSLPSPVNPTGRAASTPPEK